MLTEIFATSDPSAISTAGRVEATFVQEKMPRLGGSPPPSGSSSPRIGIVALAVPSKNSDFIHGFLSLFLQDFCFFFSLLSSGNAAHKRAIVANNYPAGSCSRSETASLIIGCCWSDSFTAAEPRPSMFGNPRKTLDNVKKPVKNNRHKGVHGTTGESPDFLEPHEGLQTLTLPCLATSWRWRAPVRFTF